MAVAIAKVIVNPVVNARSDRGEPAAARSALFSRDLTTIACCFAQFSSV
jgi:hypothetical protein